MTRSTYWQDNAQNSARDTDLEALFREARCDVDSALWATSVLDVGMTREMPAVIGQIRRTARNAVAYSPVPESVDRPPTSANVGPSTVFRLDRKRGAPAESTPR